MVCSSTTMLHAALHEGVKVTDGINTTSHILCKLLDKHKFTDAIVDMIRYVCDYYIKIHD